jgi:crotonobetainyl-CoA:carnitine CoA-transferase CaiB-like acyl-CoA transferase
MTAGGSLSGLLVADFSRVLAGPYATMLLADLGADVVKIEHPALGDDTRSWGPPFAAGEATYFLSVNRNKRSMAADLGDQASRARVLELVRRADVLIENFRPGTMAKHGLSYDEMHAINPGLVYCSITGFGTGAGAELPGYDLLVQAVGGLMSVTGPGPDQPVKAGVALVDVLTGLHATVGILAALRSRDASGQGQWVEVNLLSTLLSSLVNQGPPTPRRPWCPASWVTATRRSRRTRSSPPRTDRWLSRWETIASSGPSAVALRCQSWSWTSVLRPTPHEWHTSMNWRSP